MFWLVNFLRSKRVKSCTMQIPTYYSDKHSLFMVDEFVKKLREVNASNRHK